MSVTPSTHRELRHSLHKKDSQDVVMQDQTLHFALIAPPGAGNEPLHPTLLLRSVSPVSLFDFIRVAGLPGHPLLLDRGQGPLLASAAAFISHGSSQLHHPISALTEDPAQGWTPEFTRVIEELSATNSDEEFRYALRQFITESKIRLFDAVSFHFTNNLSLTDFSQARVYDRSCLQMPIIITVPTPALLATPLSPQYFQAEAYLPRRTLSRLLHQFNHDKLLEMIQRFVQELISTFGLENFRQFKEGAELHNGIDPVSPDPGILPFPPVNKFPDTDHSVFTFTGRCTAVGAGQGPTHSGSGGECTPAALELLMQERDSLLTERGSLKQRLTNHAMALAGFQLQATRDHSTIIHLRSRLSIMAGKYHRFKERAEDFVRVFNTRYAHVVSQQLDLAQQLEFAKDETQELNSVLEDVHSHHGVPRPDDTLWIRTPPPNFTSSPTPPPLSSATILMLNARRQMRRDAEARAAESSDSDNLRNATPADVAKPVVPLPQNVSEMIDYYCLPDYIRILAMVGLEVETIDLEGLITSAQLPPTSPATHDLIQALKIARGEDPTIHRATPSLKIAPSISSR
jgi:hypothetical protein